MCIHIYRRYTIAIFRYGERNIDMWFGNWFWPCTGKTKNDVKASILTIFFSVFDAYPHWQSVDLVDLDGMLSIGLKTHRKRDIWDGLSRSRPAIYLFLQVDASYPPPTRYKQQT